MRRMVWVGALLLMITPGVFAQEGFPPLVGPVVYGQPVPGPIVFQDLGSNEVWEIDADAVVKKGYSLSWAPNGCYALYGYWNSKQDALIDVQARTIEEIHFPSLIVDGKDISIGGEPEWSPDSRRLAYAAFDGANTHFAAYDVGTGETETLYVREGTLNNISAMIAGWPAENTLIYDIGGNDFEVDLATGEIKCQLPPSSIGPLSYLPLSEVRSSPTGEAIAVFFDLYASTEVELYSYKNLAEIEAMNQAIGVHPGIDIYVVATGETSTFDLGGQIVSAATWSPDGARLAILTWPGDDYETANGAYIYDFATNTVSPVDDLHPIRDTGPEEYGYFRPSWSADGEWVTLYVLEKGWVAYNLAEETILPLAEPIQDPISIMEVPFGPVTNYEPGACD